MSSQRLEAFSDGVLAIIITIMVLELLPPEGDQFQDLFALGNQFLTYFLSFIFIGTFWVNHHHLFALNQKVTGAILWSNLIFLFFISLTPFFTDWVAQTNFASIPVALYGINFLICGTIYGISLHLIAKDFSEEEQNYLFKEENMKTILAVVIQISCVLISLLFPNESFAAFLIYFVTVAIWILPSTKIEKYMNKKK